jgi:hypothetical protein
MSATNNQLVHSWQYKPGANVENVKGFAASAATGKMYVSKLLIEKGGKP